MSRYQPAAIIDNTPPPPPRQQPGRTEDARRLLLAAKQVAWFVDSRSATHTYEGETETARRLVGEIIRLCGPEVLCGLN